jgi:hypothetical protein
VLAHRELAAHSGANLGQGKGFPAKAIGVLLAKTGSLCKGGILDRIRELCTRSNWSFDNPSETDIQTGADLLRQVIAQLGGGLDRLPCLVRVFCRSLRLLLEQRFTDPPVILRALCVAFFAKFLGGSLASPKPPAGVARFQQLLQELGGAQPPPKWAKVIRESEGPIRSLFDDLCRVTPGDADLCVSRDDSVKAVAVICDFVEENGPGIVAFECESCHEELWVEDILCEFIINMNRMTAAMRR